MKDIMKDFDQDLNDVIVNTINEIEPKLPIVLDNVKTELIPLFLETAENCDYMINKISDFKTFLRENDKQNDALEEGKTIDEIIAFYYQKVGNYFSPLSDKLIALRSEMNGLVEYIESIESEIIGIEILMDRRIGPFLEYMKRKGLNDFFTDETGQLLSVKEIASLFQEPEETHKDSYLAFCPIHEDSEKKLRIAVNNNDVALFCYDRCCTWDILKTTLNIPIPPRKTLCRP